MTENRIIPFVVTLFLVVWNALIIFQGNTTFITWLIAGLSAVLCAFEAGGFLHGRKKHEKGRHAA